MIQVDPNLQADLFKPHEFREIVDPTCGTVMIASCRGCRALVPATDQDMHDHTAFHQVIDLILVKLHGLLRPDEPVPYLWVDPLRGVGD